MKEYFSVSSYLHSQIPVRIHYWYLMDLAEFDFSLANKKYPALLFVDNEIKFLGQSLEYRECSFKLPFRLNKDKIIGVSAIPDLRISDSLSPLSEEIFKIDVEKSRTKGGSLIYAFLDSDEFIPSLEVGVLIESLKEEDLSLFVDVQSPNDFKQSVFLDRVVGTLEVYEYAQHPVSPFVVSELL